MTISEALYAAAEFLEHRLDDPQDPASREGTEYATGYADAVARLLIRARKVERQEEEARRLGAIPRQDRTGYSKPAPHG